MHSRRTSNLRNLKRDFLVIIVNILLVVAKGDAVLHCLFAVLPCAESCRNTVSVVARYTEVRDTQRIVHKNLCLIFRNYYAFILRFWMLLKTKEMMLFYIVSEMKILSHTIFCLWLCIYILKINKKYVFRILVETLMQAFSVLFAFLRKDIIIKG